MGKGQWDKMRIVKEERVGKGYVMVGRGEKE